MVTYSCFISFQMSLVVRNTENMTVWAAIIIKLYAVGKTVNYFVSLGA